MARSIKGLIVSALVAMSSTALAGPTGQLYITQYGSTQGHIVQGDGIVGSFTTQGDFETGIAVQDSIRTINAFNNYQVGNEYDLNGVLINPSTAQNTSYASLYDGTTDGSYNYAVDHNGSGFAVFRFDTDWTNSTQLFTPNARTSGIAYDSAADSLWLSETVGYATRLQQYSLTGDFLSEFPIEVPGGYGLAYDHADGTLWVMGSFGSNSIYQYSTSGQFLGETNIAGLGNSFGAEFRLGSTQVPEPASLALLGLGALGLAWRRRRRV